MGIPAYFSHILKEHANVIKSLEMLQQDYVIIDRLYMDCNSIIYDSYREILNTNPNPSFVQILDHVMLSIGQIIERIQPKKSVVIAFDGVAPFAKMKQQRLRRFRNEYTSNISIDNPIFQTYMITPGTRFMKELSNRVTREFSNKKYKFVKEIVVSTADEPGEGEHKMMEHFRSKVKKTDNVAIYGLDSDLIMLAMFHAYMTKRIYVFREAPEFFKSKIPITFQHPKDPYFIDIKLFAAKVEEESKIPVYDYVFLCFLLGNDFLPHFQSLNLRTRGIQVIEDVYHNLPSKYKPIITTSSKSNSINWQSFYAFVFELAKIEHELFVQEYVLRERQERRYFPETTDEEKETSLQHVPQQFRSKELYIDPNVPKWEDRYYKVLFPKSTKKEEIVKNYLEGLEWVFYYYTTKCINWSWSYRYNYPPLFKDLLKQIPKTNILSIFGLISQNEPYTQYQQLNYVLPAKARYQEGLIQQEEYERLQKEELNMSLDWAFCKYLWEAHFEL